MIVLLGPHQPIPELAIQVTISTNCLQGTSYGDSRQRPSLERRSLSPEERRAFRILVVDDDEAILSTVAEILTLEGYQVDTASNGVEALERVEHKLPSLVLLDMRMPVLDGWGFARTLSERGAQLPIVVMTAAQDARRWAEEINALDYLAKPFDIVALIDLVEYWCVEGHR